MDETTLIWNLDGLFLEIRIDLKLFTKTYGFIGALEKYHPIVRSMRRNIDKFLENNKCDIVHIHKNINSSNIDRKYTIPINFISLTNEKLPCKIKWIERNSSVSPLILSKTIASKYPSILTNFNGSLITINNENYYLCMVYLPDINIDTSPFSIKQGPLIASLRQTSNKTIDLLEKNEKNIEFFIDDSFLFSVWQSVDDAFKDALMHREHCAIFICDSIAWIGDKLYLDSYKKGLKMISLKKSGNFIILDEKSYKSLTVQMLFEEEVVLIDLKIYSFSLNQTIGNTETTTSLI